MTSLESDAAMKQTIGLPGDHDGVSRETTDPGVVRVLEMARARAGKNATERDNARRAISQIDLALGPSSAAAEGADWPEYIAAVVAKCRAMMTRSQDAAELPARSRESTAPLFERAFRRTLTPGQVCRAAPGVGWAYKRRSGRSPQAPDWYGALRGLEGAEVRLDIWEGEDTAGQPFLRIRVRKED